MATPKDEHSVKETSGRSSTPSLSAAVDAAEPQNDSEAYSTGFRMWLLAGASIFGVFLISLDQVRLARSDTRLNADTLNRPFWARPFPRLRPTLAVWTTSRGIVPPTL
jgi:hypothetical protein